MKRVWRVEFDDLAERDLRGLAVRDRDRILRFLYERVRPSEDPRRLGEALTGPLKGLWRYRVGAFRILVEIQDERVTVFVVRVGNRRDVNR